MDTLPATTLSFNFVIFTLGEEMLALVVVGARLSVVLHVIVYCCDLLRMVFNVFWMVNVVSVVVQLLQSAKSDAESEIYKQIDVKIDEFFDLGMSSWIFQVVLLSFSMQKYTLKFQCNKLINFYSEWQTYWLIVWLGICWQLPMTGWWESSIISQVVISLI